MTNYTTIQLTTITYHNLICSNIENGIWLLPLLTYLYRAHLHDLSLYNLTQYYFHSKRLGVIRHSTSFIIFITLFRVDFRLNFLYVMLLLRSIIDCCNSLPVGLPKVHFSLLQLLNRELYIM